MKKRAENTIEFGGKLTLKIADVHDLILMKCATNRQKDAEDVKAIIDSQRINWKIVVEEAKHQAALGKTTAIFELGEFLEKLKEELKANIPKETINELFDLVIKQAEDKKE